MNFDLSEEQQLLKDSVDRFVGDNYDLHTRQKLSKSVCVCVCVCVCV